MKRSSSRASSRASDRKKGKSSKGKISSLAIVHKSTPSVSKRREKKDKYKIIRLSHSHPLRQFIRQSHYQGEWVDDEKKDELGRGRKRFLRSSDPVDSGDSAFIMAKSMIDPGAVYAFRLSKYGTLTTDVGGVLASSLTNDPSAWSEWSSISALFTQCKLRYAHIHFITAFRQAVPTTTSGGNWQPVVFNALYDEAAAPTTYDSCIDSPNFKMYNHNNDATNSGIRISLDFTKHGVLWGDVSAPYFY